MLDTDDHDAADRQSGELSDHRVVQRWSPDKSVGDHFSRTLALTGAAWDVYLIYPPGVAWRSDALPAPAFWTHQLPASGGADPSLRLDPESLAQAVGSMVDLHS